MARFASRLSVVGLLVLVLAAGCGLQGRADAKFGDQHFKTVISLVELHKLRHGEYPASLNDLEFLGDWDAIAMGSVEYTRVGDGYALDVTRGWVGKPTLSYPEPFWRGLGLKRTNVAKQ